MILSSVASAKFRRRAIDVGAGIIREDVDSTEGCCHVIDNVLTRGGVGETDGGYQAFRPERTGLRGRALQRRLPREQIATLAPLAAKVSAI